MPLNSGGTTAKSPYAGLMSCGQLIYLDTNTGSARLVNSITYSRAAGEVSLLYHRFLIGLATGFPVASTRFNSVRFPIRLPALLTYIVLDADTKDFTGKSSRQQSWEGSSMCMIRSRTLLRWI